MPGGSRLIVEKFKAARGREIRQPTPKPFQPSLYFFYGTLMDLERLKLVAGTEEEPQVKNATADRQYLMYWGHYPVIFSGDYGQEVTGIVWKVPNSEIAQRLREYETDHYREKLINVILEDGHSDCAFTFAWAGYKGDLSTEPVG